MRDERYLLNKADLKERAVHGPAMFPVSFYELHLNKHFTMVPLHYH